MGAFKSLLTELEANKKKAALREFEVTITETLEKTVTVEAANELEATELVETEWRNSDHILDADNYVGVTFNASPVKKELSHDQERC